MNVVIMLMVVAAVILLWYAIKGETPRELLERVFGGR